MMGLNDGFEGWVLRRMVYSKIVIFELQLYCETVYGGFFKMSYFGVKHGHLRAFLSKKK